MSATECRYGTIAVEFTQEERELIAHHAAQATLPVGRSKIFTGSDDQLELRERERSENQYVGMACEAAFAKWAESLGSGGFSAWLARREQRNQSKFTGDNGIDCYLFDNLVPVDVKGSEPPSGWAFDEDTAMKLCLTHERDMPRSKMSDIVYVFAMTSRFMDCSCISPGVVLLVGWLYGHELYGRTDREFLKGWSASGRSLHKLSELASRAPVAGLEAAV